VPGTPRRPDGVLEIRVAEIELGQFRTHRVGAPDAHRRADDASVARLDRKIVRRADGVGNALGQCPLVLGGHLGDHFRIPSGKDSLPQAVRV